MKNTQSTGGEHVTKPVGGASAKPSPSALASSEEKLTWKQRHDRVYFGYLDDDNRAMIFGAPAPMQMWCWVAWPLGGQPHVADFNSSFRGAKAAAEKVLQSWSGENSTSDTPACPPRNQQE